MDRPAILLDAVLSKLSLWYRIQPAEQLPKRIGAEGRI